MKTIKIILSFIIISLFSISCDDWLDVKPKTQVESSELLKDEAGYKDALWGVYTLMVQKSMYGLNMTVSLDAMAKIYSRVGTSATQYPLSTYSYTSTKAKSLINDVWQKTYTTIANVNNIIGNIQEADPAMFSKDNYNVIYGEALGLRAFLHFDLLRLFAPAYADDPEAQGIPYVDRFDYNITEVQTVSKTIDLILKDLEDAAALLKVADPLCTGRAITTSDDNGYLLDRTFRFNYYAVVATMARVYMWKGDKVNAALKAKEVISDSGCKWTSIDDIAIAEEKRDHTFTPEHIFRLRVEEMEKNIEYVFSITMAWATGYSFSVMDRDAAIIYPHTTDWRGWNTRYGWSENLGLNSSSIYRLPNKFWQYEDMPAEFKNLMPIIRFPEMKLIVAECNPTTEGAEIINEIRSHRGITEEFSATSTETQVLDEILNEYRREFYGEGLMWYYYKRLNKKSIPYLSYGYSYSMAMDQTKYVWPMPEEEIEFGNRNKENEL